MGNPGNWNVKPPKYRLLTKNTIGDGGSTALQLLTLLALLKTNEC